MPASPSPSRTPPSFALCGSSGASAFTATGNPIAVAAAAAAVGEATVRSFGRRTP